MVRSERARRALAMHAQELAVVLLELRHVVSHVVQQAQPAGVSIEAPEHVTHAVGDGLPVRPGEVRGRAHGAEVPLPLGRRERRARELAVG